MCCRIGLPVVDKGRWNGFFIWGRGDDILLYFIECIRISSIPYIDLEITLCILFAYNGNLNL